MRVTSVASTQLCRAPSRGAALNASRSLEGTEIAQTGRTSHLRHPLLAGLDPGVVGDRPVPHLLAALLTPTRAPHVCLQKHWEGRIVSSALVRHPLLARFSSLLLVLFSLPGFPLLSSLPLFLLRTYFSFVLHPRAVSAGCRPPQAQPAPLGHGYHDDPCALKKGGRRSSRKIAAEEEWGRASELVKECC